MTSPDDAADDPPGVTIRCQDHVSVSVMLYDRFEDDAGFVHYDVELRAPGLTARADAVVAWIRGPRHAERMSTSNESIRHQLGLTWVRSTGGPLIVVPASVLHEWGGCTEDGVILGGSERPDDYDRACAVEEFAGVIGLRGPRAVNALVLADDPATTCYLPERGVFLRWLAGNSDVELVAAAEAVLSDPETPWESCGIWETDGPAVLMDSAEAGEDLGVPYPGGYGQPDEAPVAVPAGRWAVRAYHKIGELPWVGIVQLHRC